MIVGHKDKKTEQFANGEFVKAFAGFEKQAIKRLIILDAATCLNDLRTLPSNHFEVLGGNRQGQYSIRINMQWRICFEWSEDKNASFNVTIIDDH